MFKAVISRVGGEPWGPTGMSTARWLLLPVETVTIADLIATQDGVHFHALTEPAPTPVGGDPVPHVIDWRGELYLEDGHHRVIRAMLRGDGTVEVRRLRVPAEQPASTAGSYP